MSNFITVSSITYAYKGKNALERRGCTVYIEREPEGLSKCGCHYILKIKDYPIERAVDILKDAHVKIISVGGNDRGVF